MSLLLAMLCRRWGEMLSMHRNGNADNSRTAKKMVSGCTTWRWGIKLWGGTWRILEGRVTRWPTNGLVPNGMVLLMSDPCPLALNKVWCNYFFLYFVPMIQEIDTHRRVSFHSPSAGSLKEKVPYAQLKPHHKAIQISESDFFHPGGSCIDYSSSLNLVSTYQQADSEPQVLPESLNPAEEKKQELILAAVSGDIWVSWVPIGLETSCFSEWFSPTNIWLTDEEINHAQRLLHQQFPEVDGLQNVGLFQDNGGHLLGTPKNKFVQVLHAFGNHWIHI